MSHALVDAYLLELEAIYPRILISNNVIEEIKNINPWCRENGWLNDDEKTGIRLNSPKLIYKTHSILPSGGI